MFCFKSLFSSLQSEKCLWNSLPEKVQLHIIQFLEPLEKARLSLTSRTNQEIVKKVSTNIHWLQFSPLRDSKKSLRILVFFDEAQRNNYGIEFQRNGGGCMMKVEKNGELISTKILKNNYQEMADKCLEGWLKGTNVHTLDVRGDFTGNVPPSLRVVTFSFADKYRREQSSIPNWLDSISNGPLNLLLMSDHWSQILTHSHFSNPLNTCKLTGYEEIEQKELMSSVSCRQIHLNNVKDENTFNAIAKKWVSGNLPDSFEWLIVTSLSRPLKTEKLLEDLKVQSLEKSIFKEFDDFETDQVEYFLVISNTSKLAVFCSTLTFARLLSLSTSVMEQLPHLQKEVQVFRKF